MTLHDRATDMTPTLLRIALPIAFLAAGVGALFTIGRKVPPESNTGDQKDRLPPVTTAEVIKHTGTLDLMTDGLVVPYREITVAAVVPGTIVYKSPECNEGSFVTKGTTLMRIDPRDYEFTVQRLEGEQNQAKVSLSELNVELENSEQALPLSEEDLKLRQTQLDRITELRTQRIVSVEQLEDAQRAVLTSRNALLSSQRLRDSLRTRKERLQAAIQVSDVQLAKAKLDLERTEVAALVDGVIIEDFVEQDAYVQTGAALFSVEDTAKVEVRCNLRMQEMRWIWQQARASGLPTSFGDAADGVVVKRNHSLQATDVTVKYELGGHTYTWQGKLDRYDGLGLDERTRMVPCRIVVDRPDVVSVDGKVTQVRGPRALVRGMYVNLSIHTKPRATVLSVPQRAVQPGNVVWCVRNKKLVRIALAIAQSNENTVLVDAEGSGLKVGDCVVVSPLQFAFTGLEVDAEPGS